MTLDLIPVSQLTSELGVQKTVLAERRNALGISSVKIGRNSYITKTDYDLLLELNDFIKSGGTTPEFLKSKGNNPYGNIRSHAANVPSTTSLPRDISAGLWDALVMGIRDKFAIQLLPSPDPLANYRLLEEAKEKGWALPTSQLLPILGLKSLPRLRCDDAGAFFCRRGFRFERQPKEGLESEWKIQKL